MVDDTAAPGAWPFLGPQPRPLTGLHLGLPNGPDFSHLCHLRKLSTGLQATDLARSEPTPMETPEGGWQCIQRTGRNSRPSVTSDSDTMLLPEQEVLLQAPRAAPSLLNLCLS